MPIIIVTSETKIHDTTLGACYKNNPVNSKINYWTAYAKKIFSKFKSEACI